MKNHSMKFNYLPVIYDMNRIADITDETPIITINSFFENTPV